MAFPTTPVLENFTGADGTTPPNASWSTGIFGTNGIKIETNRATRNVIAQYFNDSYWNSTTFGPDSEALAAVPVLATVNSEMAGVCVRLNTVGAGTTTGYALFVSHDGTSHRLWRLFLITAGSVGAQVGGNVLQPIAAGDLIGLEVIGTTLTAYWKSGGSAWAGVGLSGTNATYAGAGNIGFSLAITGSQGTVRLDDFGGGTYAGGFIKSGVGVIGP